jgi:hypothetical protein
VKAQIIFGIIILLIATSFQTIAQSTAFANIYAEVVASVGIRNTSDVHSGEFAVSKNSPTVPISSKNEISVSGTSPEHGGSVTLSSFSIMDTSNSTFSITLPQENINIGNGFPNSLNICNFISNQTRTGSVQGYKTGITISATLNMTENYTVCNNQAKHPFPITFNYN